MSRLVNTNVNKLAWIFMLIPNVIFVYQLALTPCILTLSLVIVCLSVLKGIMPKTPTELAVPSVTLPNLLITLQGNVLINVPHPQNRRTDILETIRA